MMNKGIANQVLDNPGLYAAIVEHRRYYVKLKNVDYNNLQMAFLNFIPPPALTEQYRKDYETMQTEMIYCESPAFNDMLNQLKELRTRLMGYENW